MDRITYTENTAINTRERYWDILKGILILIVLYIHAIGGWNFIIWDYYVSPNTVSFHVWFWMRIITGSGISIFIFISGAFVKREKVLATPKNHLIKQLKKFGLSFVIWTCIYSFIEAIVYQKSITWQSVVFGTNGIQLYYLLVMLQLILFTPLLLRNLSNKRSGLVCFLVSFLYTCFSLIYWICNKSIMPNELLLFAYWILFYQMGLMYGNGKLNVAGISLRKSGAFVGIALLIKIIESYVLLFYTNDATVSTSYVSPANFFYSITLIVWLCIIKNKKTEKYRLCFLEYLGKRTMDIFLISWLFQSPLYSVLEPMVQSGWMIPAQCIQIGITLSLSLLFSHTKEWCVNKLKSFLYTLNRSRS